MGFALSSCPEPMVEGWEGAKMSDEGGVQLLRPSVVLVMFNSEARASGRGGFVSVEVHEVVQRLLSSSSYRRAQILAAAIDKPLSISLVYFLPCEKGRDS